MPDAPTPSTGCACPKTANAPATMNTRDIRCVPNAPDQTSTTTEGVEQVGRFKVTVARGESTPESEELWNGRADALARWLLAEWQRKRNTEGVT